MGAERIIEELNVFFKERKEESNVTFTKISIVGYSLGGLYGRYLIGLLNDLGYFDKVEPVIFTTFATPHVGSIFYSDSFRSRILNLLGGNVLGVSGNDLFANNSTILSDMANPELTFFKGLKKFKHLLLFANAIHDRTVPFYTGYISLKDPFQHRDFIDHQYFHYDNEKYLLEYNKIPNTPVRDMFVDMENSRFLSESTGVEAGVTIQERQFQAFALFALPWIFPIVFAITSVTTIVSHYKVREARKANTTLAIDYLGEEDDESAPTTPHPTHEPGHTSRLAEWAGDAVDEVLAADSVDDHQLNDFPKGLDRQNKEKGVEDCDTAVGESIKVTEGEQQLSIRPNFGTGTKGLIDETPHNLTLSPEVKELVNSLNTLPWEKYVVKLERMHSHAEIVNRRNKPGQGQRVVAFWVELVDSKLNDSVLSSRAVSPENV